MLAFPAKLHAIRVLLCEICQIIPSPKLFVLGFCIAVNFIKVMLPLLGCISERRFLSGGQDPVMVGFQHSTLQFSKLYH